MTWRCFFAGRGAEIARFDSALRESSGKRQAVFRIFQGARGCGKTSLAAHLRANRTTDVLFVPVGKGDLKSRDALFARVGEAIDAERSRGGKVAQAAAQAVGAWLKPFVGSWCVLTAAFGRSKLCRREVRRLKLDEDRDFGVEPVDFVRQMVEKGVLSPTGERRYVVPTPSMLTWLGDRHGASTPEAHPTF